MSEWLIWLLTRTMIPRAIAMAIAGLFVTWGVLSDEPTQREMWDANGNKIIVEETQKNLVGEAIALLIVGGLSLFIENRKATEVKKTQKLLDKLTPAHTEVIQDGLAGPETRKAIKLATEDKAPEPTQTKEEPEHS